MTEFRVGDLVRVTGRSYAHHQGATLWLGIFGAIDQIEGLPYTEDENCRIIHISYGNDKRQGFFQFRLEYANPLEIDWKVKNV